MINKLHALLIGIDCYLPNRLPGGAFYSSLSGCVRDVSQIEHFLQEKLNISSDYILKLIASNIGATEPPEAYDKWPTYQNIVSAFQKLIDISNTGDHVYIHYSGHGGRTLAKFPERKSNGLDECLVPLDIGNSEARYFRDIELVHILDKMVRKGLNVTVVLDSCHSGGMVRGNSNAAIRGISEIDRTQRPLESLIASDIELENTWNNSFLSTRSLKLGSGWLPEPKGYVLLSACRPSEFAYEYAFNGIERNGVLTYWLLDSLKQISSTLTYKHLHDRIVAKIRSQFQNQTPLLQGEGDQQVFGVTHLKSKSAVNVLKTDLNNQRILLNTGKIQSVHNGTQFAIYPFGETSFSQIDRRLALVEITELGVTESWAIITKQISDKLVEQGSQAVLLDLNNIRLYRKIRVIYQSSLPETIDQESALNQVKYSVKTLGKGFLELVEEGESIDFQVAVNSSNDYEIWDAAGQLIDNLRPPILFSSLNASQYLTERLVHLTKFYNILNLENTDHLSSLKLTFELIGIQVDYDPIDPPKPIPFKDSGSTQTLNEGEWTFARIRNDSCKVFNITVLDLQPDWGITQIYPSDQDTYFWPLDPGEEVLLPLQAYLPSSYTEVKDVIKVFATVKPVNFRWLELPPLDQPSVRGVDIFRKPENELEEFLTWISPSIQHKRHLNPPAFSRCEWVTSQVEIRIQEKRS